ncbi:MAG: hypothetical protein GXY44_16165 [Phycisphaerales bacterium]|nr:hypothetical protein [Phycisphaerales bacterium]
MNIQLGIMMVGLTSLMLAAGCRQAAPCVPIYHCHYTEQSPVIDGQMNEEAWHKAEVVNLTLADTGRPPRQPTTARALWSDTHLYIAFECIDNDIWASETERDAPIYNHEVVEVFIDDNGDGKTYIELEISPNNTVFDAYVLNAGQGKWLKVFSEEYTCEGMQTAVVVNGEVGDKRGSNPSNCTQWSVEIAIPFSQFAQGPNLPPSAGDQWRWNLYRIDRPAQAQDDEYTAWSPPGEINFHRPDKFGWLVFCK